ncbi:MAG TPA: YbjQ family protein [Jatrophihabitans sp.]|nr:YbjQ family protein [Jatrophihabitans sp.]
MLCVTMNDIPGWEVQRVCGEVFGVTVRSRNAFSQMGAGFKSLVGGELQGMTKNVIDSRNEAMTRLFAEAQARGGNALIAMRFDTTELGSNWTEICAYGTAVVAIPVTEAAKQTAIQLGYGQPGASRPAQQPVQQPPAQQQPAGQWDQPTNYQSSTGQPTNYQPGAQPTDYQQGAQPAGHQPGTQPTGHQQPGGQQQPSGRSEWDRPSGE